MEAINSYDGPGFVGAGAGKPQKRDGVKLTHRELMSKFCKIGDEALNAGDYARTMHLPVGKGRLACDPDTGDFDKDADRPRYDPSKQPFYPRFVHSTITEGEQIVVENKEEHEQALATRKWADKPIERRKRFTLTPEDQMQNLKGQIEAERAARFQLERQMEAGVFGAGPDEKENANLLALELQQEREARKALEDRVNLLLARLEPKPDDDGEGDEAAVTAGAKSRRR